MPTYLVTFKLARNHTYADRHDRFMAALQKGDWWAETGCSVVAYAPEAIDEFCKRIFQPSAFDPRVDVAVVFDLDLRDGRAKGDFRDIGLFSIAPWLERL
jgi:hypothetical protein